MIQIHSIDGIEAAIQMGALMPPTAAPKSRHRFWIGKHRVDAYINRERVVYIHWLNRATGNHEHPREGGMTRCRLYPDGTAVYFYGESGTWTKEFRSSFGFPERGGK